MPFNIVRQDITKMHVDAVVNAANTRLMQGGGVCGAVFKAAGAQALQEACNKLSPIKTGEAVATSGFDMPCKYIIHTAGPVYDAQNAEQSERLLKSAYLNSLLLAEKKNCESIAFPLISSGIYGYPKQAALCVASTTIQSFLQTHDMDIYLAVFDKDAFSVSKKLMGRVESYIDENYVKQSGYMQRRGCESAAEYQQSAGFAAPLMPSMAAPSFKAQDAFEKALDEPFSQILLKLIDKKGKTDVEVYKRANIDRKLFSKIRKGGGYMPSKRTVLALAVALELSLKETNELLKCAGYALSHSQMFDVIIEYFIKSESYDIFEINEVLFKYDCQLLGG